MSLRFESPEDGMDASFTAPATKEGKAQLRAMREWFRSANCTVLVTKMTQGKDKFFCLVVKFPDVEEDELESDEEEEEQEAVPKRGGGK